MAGKKEYQTYGLDFELTISGQNETMDLALVVVEINMFEDMFGPFMRLEVVINDSLGLFDKYPLIGEETLTFKRKNPNDMEYTQEFKVYAVSERKLINTRSHALVLHAMSLGGMDNAREYVYKSFIKKKPHDIVEEVYFEYFPETLKSITVDPAENDYTKIASGVNPIKLINEMAGEAKSAKYSGGSNGPSSYVFFENANQFYFAPIPYFFDAEVMYKFKLGVPMEDKQFESGEAWPGESIRSISFINNFDNIEQPQYGAYTNEINIIDPILKRFKMHPIEEKNKYQFDYNRDFGSLKHLPNSNKKYLLGNDVHSPAAAKNKQASHRRLLTTHIEEDGENYPTIGYLAGRVTGSDNLNAPRKRHEFLPATLHEKANLGTHNIEITVSGVVEIYVGMLAEIYIPQPTQTSADHQKFLYLYGQQATFLITAIRHIYQAADDAYYCVISLAKESFGQTPTPLPFDNSPED